MSQNRLPCIFHNEALQCQCRCCLLHTILASMSAWLECLPCAGRWARLR